jgi:hypothetical protein
MKPERKEEAMTDFNSLTDAEIVEQIKIKEAEERQAYEKTQDLRNKIVRLKAEQILRAIPSLTDASLKETRIARTATTAAKGRWKRL